MHRDVYGLQYEIKKSAQRTVLDPNLAVVEATPLKQK